MFVKVCLVLILIPLLMFVVISFALMGLAEEASHTLTWFARGVGLVCFCGYVGVSVALVDALWPRRVQASR